MKIKLQHIFHFIIGGTLIFSTVHCASNKPDSNRKLIWSDEFNYKGLPDSSKWNYDVGGDGYGNNEAQFYTKNRPENARVETEILSLKPKKKTGERINTLPQDY